MKKRPRENNYLQSGIYFYTVFLLSLIAGMLMVRNIAIPVTINSISAWDILRVVFFNWWLRLMYFYGAKIISILRKGMSLFFALKAYFLLIYNASGLRVINFYDAIVSCNI